MAAVTETKLRSTLDIPVALPATTIKQGDWVVVATVNISTGQRLSLRHLTLQVISATVNMADIAVSNRVVTSFGPAYLVLRKNYVSGSPAAAGTLDTLSISAVGVVNRTGSPLFVTDPGYYSVIVVNNCQASTSSTISTATAIDLQISVTGCLRLELVGV